MALTLGIDPGSRMTGFGVLEQTGNSIVYAGSGVIRAASKKSKPERLQIIKNGID